MGRKKIPPEKKRETILEIAVTEEEAKRIRAEAALDGVSNWLRRLALRELERARRARKRRDA